jgi:uncharacterized protein (DUF952 family)
VLYHITSEAAAKAFERGSYKPELFDREGFIHCSYAHQVVAVANRIFKGRTDLVLLQIDPSRLKARIVEENLEGGTELFPHVYGELERSAVTRVIRFPCDGTGRFQFPEGVGSE